MGCSCLAEDLSFFFAHIVLSDRRLVRQRYFKLEARISKLETISNDEIQNPKFKI